MLVGLSTPFANLEVSLAHYISRTAYKRFYYIMLSTDTFPGGVRPVVEEGLTRGIIREV